MPQPRPLPQPLGGGPFTVSDALLSGVTPGRLRGEDLAAPFYGLRTTDLPEGLAALALAYAPKLRPGEHFCGAAALSLCGVAVPRRLANAVDVAAARPVGRPRGRGIRGHEATDARVVEARGVPIAHPADAWCQMAAVVDDRELVILGDALLRRGHPVLRREDLDEAVARHAGRRGARRMRRALEKVRARTDSDLETTLRLAAAAAGLPEPEVNGVILDEHGAFVGYGDLVYRRYKVILEYDGAQHRTDEKQFARDVDRLDDFARLGWRVVRVNKSHADFSVPLLRVREALLSRGWVPGASS